jgi:capsular exopolysaccharide synthesis family protein
MPHVRGKRNFKLATLAIDHPDSKLAESVRSLRASLTLGNEGKLPKVLHLTSCHPGEGKSTIAVNLASSLAQTGKRVLLVDADLRRPAVHRYLKLNNEMGLANYLTGERVIPQKLEGFERFMVMTAGPALHDPVSALDSKHMDELLHKARLVFDHIIIDAPPILGMADSLILASRADGTLLVVADERSTQPEINEVVRLIQSSQGKIVSVVHNMSKQKSTHTYSQRGYSDGRAVLRSKTLTPQF